MLSSVLTTVGSYHVGKKEGWLMADLFGLRSPRYGLLTFGIFLIALAMFYTYTGKAYARFHGWVYRADDPKGYWLEVAVSYLLGLGLIGLFLYENSFSN
jgi:hypothetical protein